MHCGIWSYVETNSGTRFGFLLQQVNAMDRRRWCSLLLPKGRQKPLRQLALAACHYPLDCISRHLRLAFCLASTNNWYTMRWSGWHGSTVKAFSNHPAGLDRRLTTGWCAALSPCDNAADSATPACGRHWCHLQPLTRRQVILCLLMGDVDAYLCIPPLCFVQAGCWLS